MSEILHTAPDGTVYRWAHELNGTEAPPATGPAAVLRMVDLDEETRAAGLRPNFDDDSDDHASPATMVTTRFDAMVVRAKLPDNEPAQDDALLGIGYRRLLQQLDTRGDNRAKGRIWIPAKLKEWRVQGRCFQHTRTMTVRAACRESAKVIASVRILNGTN